MSTERSGEGAGRTATGSGPTSAACRCSRSSPTACRSRSRASTAACPHSRSCTPAGGDCWKASPPRASRRSGAGSWRRRSGRRSGPAATRCERTSPSPSGGRSGSASSARAGSISGALPSARCARPVWRVSTASISAPPATPTCSSPSDGQESHVESKAFSALSAETVRSNLERIRSELGQDVTIVAAVKYVDVDQLGALAEAGIDVVGENRAQDLAAKHARYGDAFRWHFIGHLQSRKAPSVSEVCELCHSLGSESAAQELTIPALVEVHLSGEATTSGIPPADLPRFLELALTLGVTIRGLMTMPP